jgi:type IV pilus assembly protein PilM
MGTVGLFKQAGVVGLEMDTGVIRAVELRGKSGSAELVAAGMVEIPEEAVVEGTVADVSAVSDALGRLWAEAKFGSRDVVLGVFNQGVITRMINFPKVPESKLDQAIRLQAQEYFPIPLSQMILDFAVVGETNVNTRPELEVLLVAARISALEKCLAALQESRLKPKVIDASPLALMRTLPREKFAGTVAVVNICNGLGSLLMMVDGVPRFARVIPVSLQQYAAQLGLTLKDVPAPFGGEETEQYVAAAGETMAFGKWGLAVAEEVRSTINYFIKMEDRLEVDSLVLSGGGARITGLPELLQDELGVTVDVIQTLANVAASAKKQTNREAALPDFAVSAGLALRGLEG